MEAKLNKKIDLEEVKKKILTHFKILFQVENRSLYNSESFNTCEACYFSSLKYTL